MMEWTIIAWVICGFIGWYIEDRGCKESIVFLLFLRIPLFCLIGPIGLAGSCWNSGIWEVTVPDFKIFKK